MLSGAVLLNSEQNRALKQEDILSGGHCLYSLHNITSTKPKHRFGFRALHFLQRQNIALCE